MTEGTESTTPSTGETPFLSAIIQEPESTKQAFLDLISRAKEEILLLLPSQAAFRREEGIGVIALIEEAARRGVSVSILAPIDEGVLRSIASMNASLSKTDGHPVELTEVTEAIARGTVTVLVVDRRASLVIEQVRPSEAVFEKAIGTSVYSISNPTVRASIRFIERVKEGTTLRKREEAVAERERKSKRQAQLLQDILAHDIRTYNQIIMSSAEALREEPNNFNPELVEAIIRATKGSTGLLDKAVKLSRIVSEGDAPLRPVRIEDSVERALNLVSNANPSKRIALTPPPAGHTMVFADELLDEVFINLLSNAVKNTPSDEVRLSITVDLEESTPAVPSPPLLYSSSKSPDDSTGSPRQLVRVKIADHGTGVPDYMKKRLFTRYQTSGGGSGLGLSIVHALVIGRYGGGVRLTDRVQGQSDLGTKVELTLPAAPPEP